MKTSTNTKHEKKRVRFEHDSENTRNVKRRIQEISFPKSSLLTMEEKTCYWMQPEDHRDTLHDVLSLMHDCHHKVPPANTTNNPNMVPFSQYAEALALTFSLCDTPPLCTEEEGENNENEAPLWNIRDSHSVAQLALWASNHTPTRGVESKILPGLHNERQLRRARAIKGVLEAQTRLAAAPVDEKISSLGTISRSLSHSAKQFATALAVVDGTQAYLEYTGETNGHQQCSAREEQGRSAVSVTPTKELEQASTNKPINLEAAATSLMKDGTIAA